MIPGDPAVLTSHGYLADSYEREYSARVPERHDGSGALSKAFSDPVSTVRVAAYVAAGRINSFTDVAAA